MERLRLFQDEGLRLHVGVQPRGIADFLRDAGGHPHELLLQERGQLVGFRLLHHGHERAELDSMRMRRDFFGLRRQILRGPLEDDLFAFGRPIRNARMRIHDRRGLEVFRDRLLSRVVAALQRDFDPCAMGPLPDHEVFFDHVRPVLLRIQDELDFVSNVLLRDLRSNLRWLAGRNLTVHDRTGNPKTLLSASLSAAKKRDPYSKRPKTFATSFLMMPGPLSSTTTTNSSLSIFLTSTRMSGRMSASAPASRELSTPSLTAVRRAFVAES